VAYPEAAEMRVAGKVARMYVAPLELVRSITLAKDPQVLATALDAGGDLVINGTVRFQACRGDECYSVRSLPLRWRVQAVRSRVAALAP
jgi:hypothetical protein